MSINFKQIEDRLKTEAKKLLEEEKVSLVLAYGKGYDEKHPLPYVARKTSDIENIVFNEYCTANMARYLVRYPRGTKIAIAVKAADSRAVIQLIQEDKVKREDLIVLGIPVYGMKNFKTGETIDSKTTCGMYNPVIYDTLLGEEVHGQPIVSPYDVLAEYEKMDKDARWAFWKKELDRCIRCYACRKACPMCYCDPCFIDQNKPKWGEKSPESHGNLMYHLTRFHHLAGRCIDCGECSRACPVDIPLYLFHKKVAKECEEMFGQAAGMKIEDKPALVNFRVDDSDKILE
ncbi:coenzyme f420-reducing hydrogenase, beta subunit [hydrocarbon metagenome]|uniref:Coenzyme f420-reducing hydrogenase, beta subunit n=1 Tax=hydrocarbon metagenome TaxID=938273 RepID=A0A0W8FP03_9ZZZZ